MGKAHIMVVDDEPNMLHTLEFILEAADYRVTTVQDGQEALEGILKAKENNSAFDLLIVDIQMCGLIGMKLIDELNRLHVDIPIFVITGYGDKRLVIELLRRGCKEYLDKPFDDEELVKRVDKLLSKRGEGTRTNAERRR